MTESGTGFEEKGENGGVPSGVDAVGVARAGPYFCRSAVGDLGITAVVDSSGDRRGDWGAHAQGKTRETLPVLMLLECGRQRVGRAAPWRRTLTVKGHLGLDADPLEAVW